MTDAERPRRHRRRTTPDAPPAVEAAPTPEVEPASKRGRGYARHRLFAIIGLVRVPDPGDRHPHRPRLGRRTRSNGVFDSVDDAVGRGNTVVAVTTGRLEERVADLDTIMTDSRPRPRPPRSRRRSPSAPSTIADRFSEIRDGWVADPRAHRRRPGDARPGRPGPAVRRPARPARPRSWPPSTSGSPRSTPTSRGLRPGVDGAGRQTVSTAATALRGAVDRVTDVGTRDRDRAGRGRGPHRPSPGHDRHGHVGDDGRPAPAGRLRRPAQRAPAPASRVAARGSASPCGLTAWEEERLLIFTAAELARRHRDRGLALNAPEAIALICDAMLEAARAGATYAEVEAAGRAAVAAGRGARPASPRSSPEVRLEVLLDDGTRLVVLLEPLGPAGVDAPGRDPPGRHRRARHPADDARATDARGPQHVDAGSSGSRQPLPVRAGQPAARVRSRGGDRLPPRPRRRLDRALGTRRDPRRPPRHAWSATDDAACRPPSAWPATARRPATGSASATPTCGSASATTARRAATSRSGATPRPSARGRPRAGPSDSELDAVVAGALVLDPVLGAIKADIGIKDGRIVGVGRAGNDAISDGIELPIGPHTQPIMGYGLIATPGAVDSHVHLITPELLPAALSGGVTTLITAGFEEPPAAMARLLDGDRRLAAQRRAAGLRPGEDDGSLEALLDAGACGFKIHEDYGADPELIDHTLRFAETHDVSVALHTDGLHESAELEDTVAAIDGRTVHAYHVEGSGGGHVPDVIGLVREPNIICSSTTPTVPWGVHAAAEQVPMIVLNHGASFGVAEDVALVRERVHEATMAAEGPLHELGAIAIVNSDSQGMGRMMETVRRTFQLAHVMRGWPGRARSGPARRHGARPALPGQGDHRAGDHPRHRRPRRLAPAGPTGRHRAVGAGLLRGQAGARAQGRHRRLGAARRGQRDGRGRRADPLSAGLGRAGPLGGAAGSVTFVSGRGWTAPDRDARRPRRTLASRSRGTRGLTRAVAGRTTARRRRSRSMSRTARVTLDGRAARGRPGRARCRSAGATCSADRCRRSLEVAGQVQDEVRRRAARGLVHEVRCRRCRRAAR